MCGEINFQERTGEECLAGWVDVVLAKVRDKYKEYGIEREPFVIVKADAGTYGMGIMTVKDPADVRDLNRKQRNKMAVVKEGLSVTDVLVQEGVYTFETVKDAVAEPVIYMIDQFVVGGFYRVHTGRGQDENLNAPGMQFEPMPFDTSCLLPDPEANPDCAVEPHLRLRRDRPARPGGRQHRAGGDGGGARGASRAHAQAGVSRRW